MMETETKFKIGDRIKVIKSDGDIESKLLGECGTITDTNNDSLLVEFDNHFPFLHNGKYNNLKDGEYHYYWLMADQLEKINKYVFGPPCKENVNEIIESFAEQSKKKMKDIIEQCSDITSIKCVLFLPVGERPHYTIEIDNNIYMNEKKGDF